MIERKKHPLELIGLAVAALGLAMLIWSQFGPTSFPDVPDGMDGNGVMLGEYRDQLAQTQSQMAIAVRLSFIGGWLVSLGCFGWIGGLILSVAEILRNKE